MGHFHVKAILRNDKMRKDCTCPIYLIISIRGKSIKLPVGIHGFAEEWISKAGIFDESGSSLRNTIIKKKVAAIEEFLWQQIVTDNEISIDLVRFHFGKSRKVDFIALLDDCYKIQFRIIAQSTKKHYLLVRRRLVEFQEHIGLHKVGQNFLLNFEKFLRSKGVGDSGIGTHHKVIRVVVNYGLKRKIISDNPYVCFKVKRESPSHIPLSETQIKSIRTLQIPKEENKINKCLELSRDLFLFGCYTALRFSDIMRLSKEQVTTSCLIVRQSKTGSIVQIPLMEQSASIIHKYVSDDRNSIFPSVSNQVVNRNLKRIAKMCGIESNVHFHLSRHSFGSIMANSGLNPFSLGKLMGHSSIKTTMLYVNETLLAVKEQMGRSSLFRKD